MIVGMQGCQSIMGYSQSFVQGSDLIVGWVEDTGGVQFTFNIRVRLSDLGQKCQTRLSFRWKMIERNQCLSALPRLSIFTEEHSYSQQGKWGGRIQEREKQANLTAHSVADVGPPSGWQPAAPSAASPGGSSGAESPFRSRAMVWSLLVWVQSRLLGSFTFLGNDPSW